MFVISRNTAFTHGNKPADPKQLGRELGVRYVERISLFEKALALDPQSVEAQIRLAAVLVGRVLDGMADSAATDLASAEGLVGQALGGIAPLCACAYHQRPFAARSETMGG